MSKVWFVTGSSRGLGRNFVEAALSRGDKVAATARNTGSLDELVAAYGDAVLPLGLDVTDKAAVFESVKRAKEHFGRLGVIVNNAGHGLFGAVEELTERQLRDQLEANLFGAPWVIQAALPHLREQGAGHIIQMSSIGGVAAYPLRVFFGIQGNEIVQKVYADRLKTWADWRDLSVEAHGKHALETGDPRAELFET